MDLIIKKLHELVKYNEYYSEILLCIAEYAHIDLLKMNEELKIQEPVKEGFERLFYELQLLHTCDSNDKDSYLYNFCKEYQYEIMEVLYTHYYGNSDTMFKTIGETYFKGDVLSYIAHLVKVDVIEYVLIELRKVHYTGKQIINKIITPEELRFTFEVIMDSKFVKLFESFAILDGTPLYNYDIEKNNGYITANRDNFKKFAVLLTDLYSEGTYKCIKSITLYELYSKHKKTIESIIFDACEKNKYDYSSIGRAIFTDVLGSTMASKAIDFLLDTIVEDLAYTTKKDISSIDKRGNIKWDYKHMLEK